MNLQGVVDFRCRFLNAFTGFPGRAHDGRVFASSNVYLAAESGELFDNIEADIAGVKVKPFLIADAAYPLRPWLMKSYPEDGRMTEAKVEFNTCLNTARNVVERAFGILKTRFRCLRKQIDMSVANAPELIIACCCLHNWCIDNHEPILEEWEMEELLDELEDHERAMYPNEEELISAARAARKARITREARVMREQNRAENFDISDVVGANNRSANTIRSAIRDYLYARIENENMEN